MLGDVRCRVLFTDGALYVGGDLEATEVAWTTGSGWFLRARKLLTKVYVNEADHPDVFEELAVERSFEVLTATRETLGMVFRAELFSDDGRLAGWRLLDPIANGDDVFWSPPVVDSVENSTHILETLRAHLGRWPGSQRELLADLEVNWAERSRQLVPEDRTTAAKLVRAKIRSRKLEGARDVLLRALESD